MVSPAARYLFLRKSQQAEEDSSTEHRCVRWNEQRFFPVLEYFVTLDDIRHTGLYNNKNLPTSVVSSSQRATKFSIFMPLSFIPNCSHDRGHF